MSRKLTALIILIIGGIIFVHSIINHNRENHSVENYGNILPASNNKFELINDQDTGIRIVKFSLDENKLEYLYLPENEKSIKQIAQENQFLIAVNGGYFSGKYMDATHAGLLKLNSETIVPMAYGDNQITHVVSYVDNKLEFIPNSDYSNSKNLSSQFAFQTGPLIVEDMSLANSYIENSLNGLEKANRTVIGYTTDGYGFFLVTSKRYTLDEIGLYLVENNLGLNVESAINLDGGLSSALYVSEDINISYNSNWLLPIIIGLK